MIEQSVVLKKGENEIGVTVKDAPSKLVVRMNDGTLPVLYQEVVPRKREMLSLVSRTVSIGWRTSGFPCALFIPDSEKMTAELECAGQKISVKGALNSNWTAAWGIADGTHKATVTMLMNGKK
jgi:hypothetical protein